MKKEYQVLLDALVRKDDQIRVLCETIDKLSDKILAKDFQEYKHLNDNQNPEPITRLKDESELELQDMDGAEIIKSLDEQ